VGDEEFAGFAAGHQDLTCREAIDRTSHEFIIGHHIVVMAEAVGC
tara:strand:- start:148 stop:282 length:135 start_codon:yes stop_codon:yes gene_type:complete